MTRYRRRGHRGGEGRVHLSGFRRPHPRSRSSLFHQRKRTVKRRRVGALIDSRVCPASSGACIDSRVVKAYGTSIWSTFVLYVREPWLVNNRRPHVCVGTESTFSADGFVFIRAPVKSRSHGPAEDALMVGDDVDADVRGAQALGDRRAGAQRQVARMTCSAAHPIRIILLMTSGAT